MRLPLSRFEHDTDGPGRSDPDILTRPGLLIRVHGSSIAADSDRLVYGEAEHEENVIYLGKVGDQRYYAAQSAGDGFASMREIAPKLSDLEAGLATVATAIVIWQGQNRHCRACGQAVSFIQGGWEAVCACGLHEYPRQDPSVIMAIRDRDDRLLLGHGATWQPGRYSCLAGFVEAGESFENAVERESFEEAGVHITATEYVGSQPWPFPRSVMVAFRAWTDSTDADIAVDGVEVSDARFWSRDDFAAALAFGQISIPSPVSAGRALIEDWYGEPLPSTGA